LRAVRTLREAGVNAGVLMAPIVPGFTTQPAKLEATIKAVADHGAAFMGVNLLYLKAGTKDHFMGFLAREHPELLDGYNRLYPGAYAPSPYKDAVRQLVHSLQERHDVRRRTYEAPSDPESEENSDNDTEVEQANFDW
jgi:DNA repair photolyase